MHLFSVASSAAFFVNVSLYFSYTKQKYTVNDVLDRCIKKEAELGKYFYFVLRSKYLLTFTWVHKATSSTTDHIQ